MPLRRAQRNWFEPARWATWPARRWQARWFLWLGVESSYFFLRLVLVFGFAKRFPHRRGLWTDIVILVYTRAYGKATDVAIKVEFFIIQLGSPSVPPDRKYHTCNRFT